MLDSDAVQMHYGAVLMRSYAGVLNYCAVLLNYLFGLMNS